MQITETQIAQVNNQIQALLKAESFYGKKLEEAGVTSIQSAEDFQKLPFSEKNDLRNAYPLGLMTAPTGQSCFNAAMNWPVLQIWTVSRSHPDTDSGLPESDFRQVPKD